MHKRVLSKKNTYLLYLRDQANLSLYLSSPLLYFCWGLGRLGVQIFILPTLLFMPSFLIWDLLRKIEKEEEKGTLTWIWILTFSCKTFFYHLLIYFHIKHPISALHKNHVSFEALKLVFWFSVGKDKIYVGCYWNKMYFWDSGILLWFLSFSCSNYQL